MTRLPLRALLIGTVFACTACDGATEFVPPDGTDDIARWFFAHHRDTDGAEVEASLSNLVPVLEQETVSGARVGGLDSLTKDDIAFTGLDNDPKNALGFFLMNRLDCDLDTVEEIITAPNQTDLYKDVYDSYERTYGASRDEYLAGSRDDLPWTIDYSATPISETYHAVADAGVWRVETESWGKVLMQSSFLPEPADFGGAENHVFDQDYQVELYFKADDGSVLHFYPIWRYLQLGSFNVGDDVFANLFLDGLVDWDDNTEKLCATWPELPE